MNLVCISCIQAAEDETWSAITASTPADLCISLGAQMSAHDCAGSLSQYPCKCAYPHNGGLEGTDPIQVLQVGQQYALKHGHNPIANEGMRRAINRALVLLMTSAVEDGLRNEEPNTNTKNLIGIRCPKCGSYEPFFITYEATYTVYDGNSTRNGHAWGLDSDIVCAACQHHGIVGEFQKNLIAGEIMHLEGEEEAEAAAEAYDADAADVAHAQEEDDE